MDANQTSREPETIKHYRYKRNRSITCKHKIMHAHLPMCVVASEASIKENAHTFILQIII